MSEVSDTDREKAREAAKRHLEAARYRGDPFIWTAGDIIDAFLAGVDFGLEHGRPTWTGEPAAELRAALEALFSLPNWENRGAQSDVRRAMADVYTAFTGKEPRP